MRLKSPEIFVNVVTFAEAANIGLRGAQKALANAANGHPWREHRLTVRAVIGRGGNAGTNYEVEIGSLPPEIQSIIAPTTQFQLPLMAPLATSKDWRMRLVMAVQASGDRASKARGCGFQCKSPTYSDLKSASVLI